MTRVWCDGPYGIVDVEYANQLRQAKKMGKFLVVGIHNDEEIMKHRCRPLYNEHERYRMIGSIKWVDEVVKDAPYLMTTEILNKYDCDFCVNGSDTTLTPDGFDSHANVKKVNRYKELERTGGVSTTDLVKRILNSSSSSTEDDIDRIRKFSMCERVQSVSTKVVKFTPEIVELIQGNSPAANDIVVYVCGAFDLFHVGHLCFLEEARKLGHYLIVGIFSDQDINEYKGDNHPIMSLHERVLSVLAYKPVNEVIIGAPIQLTKKMIEQFGISIVVNGISKGHEEERFMIAKELGIYREVDSKSDIKTEAIIERIIKNQRVREKRDKKKEKRKSKSD